VVGDLLNSKYEIDVIETQLDITKVRMQERYVTKIIRRITEQKEPVIGAIFKPHGVTQLKYRVTAIKAKYLRTPIGANTIRVPVFAKSNERLTLSQRYNVPMLPCLTTTTDWINNA
tara:strand:+ start:39 stop:386 length:348 start_codon:yes stop_codon:yes gene_type:complete